MRSKKRKSFHGRSKHETVQSHGSTVSHNIKAIALGLMDFTLNMMPFAGGNFKPNIDSFPLAIAIIICLLASLVFGFLIYVWILYFAPGAPN
jgi:hypothetical protein